MSQYKGLAYERLSYSGEARNVEKGVAEFMEALCELEDELLDLERRVSEQDLDSMGWNATLELTQLETEHASYQAEIGQAHEAIMSGHLNRLERNPYEEGTARTQEAMPDYRDDFLRTVNRIEDISSRVGRRIDAKRNSANTRLILTVSVIAALISFFALFSQLLGILF